MTALNITTVAALFILGGLNMARAELTLGKAGEHFPFDLEKHVFLSQTQADFEKESETWSWISDVEHVIEKEEKKLVFLADGDPAYFMCGDTIPANKKFELFPYHYYSQWEVDQLGTKINYKLIAQNRTNEYLNIDISGAGTVTNWDNWITWRDALAGKNKKNITLAPGETVTLWEEKQLEGDLPWSGIFLGKASGDLYVADYCYTGETDPGIDKAEQMLDLSWPPYLLASFSRGSADWNAARIDMFPKQRDDNGRIELGQIENAPYSIAFAYSPGGPPTNYSFYKAVPNTFAEDYVRVNDPVSGWNHVFLGGNYPIMYRFRLPVINDTKKTKQVSFYLSSNDIFGVDTLAGVWIEGQLLHDRVRLWKANEHWKVFTITLKPGEAHDQQFTVVPLGSRWGGMIGSVEITDASPPEAE